MARSELITYRAYDFEGETVIETSSLTRFLSMLDERLDRKYLTLKQSRQVVLYYEDVEEDLFIQKIDEEVANADSTST